MSAVDLPTPQCFYCLPFKFIVQQRASSRAQFLFPSGRLRNASFNPRPERFVLPGPSGVSTVDVETATDVFFGPAAAGEGELTSALILRT